MRSWSNSERARIGVLATTVAIRRPVTSRAISPKVSPRPKRSNRLAVLSDDVGFPVFDEVDDVAVVPLGEDRRAGLDLGLGHRCGELVELGRGYVLEDGEHRDPARIHRHRSCSFEHSCARGVHRLVTTWTRAVSIWPRSGLLQRSGVRYRGLASRGLRHRLVRILERERRSVELGECRLPRRCSSALPAPPMRHAMPEVPPPHALQLPRCDPSERPLCRLSGNRPATKPRSPCANQVLRSPFPLLTRSSVDASPM